jgi:tRNA (mo5U34)-methyltransferase
MSDGRQRLEARVASVPVWFHAIDLGQGVVTPGVRAWDLESLGVADGVEGRSVLDIGAWDGFFSFEAERHGAARVVALDHYVWSLDLEGWERHNVERRSQGLEAMPAHEVPGLWQPQELPGRRGFDLAHEVLGSTVEPVVGDFMEVDLDRLGTFDIVFYLGVLYHMENPLQALRRLRRVTGDLAVVETEAMRLPGAGDRAVFEFFPSTELAADPSNWWSPSPAGFEAICRAAGFSSVSIIASTEGNQPPDEDGLSRFRLVAHLRP